MPSLNTTGSYVAKPAASLWAGLVALTLIITGCTGPHSVEETQPVEKGAPAAQPDSKPTANSLENTDWKAVSILGKPAGSAESTLGFIAAGRVSGNGACNGYQGEVTLQGSAIEFGALATTRMMCAPPINGQEIVFLEALGLARSWKQSGNVLELIDETDTVVVRLTRQ